MKRSTFVIFIFVFIKTLTLSDGSACKFRIRIFKVHLFIFLSNITKTCLVLGSEDMENKNPFNLKNLINLSYLNRFFNTIILFLYISS